MYTIVHSYTISYSFSVLYLPDVLGRWLDLKFWPPSSCMKVTVWVLTSFSTIDLITIQVLTCYTQSIMRIGLFACWLGPVSNLDLALWYGSPSPASLVVNSVHGTIFDSYVCIDNSFCCRVFGDRMDFYIMQYAKYPRINCVQALFAYCANILKNWWLSITKNPPKHQFWKGQACLHVQ